MPDRHVILETANDKVRKRRKIRYTFQEYLEHFAPERLEAERRLKPWLDEVNAIIESRINWEEMKIMREKINGQRQNHL